MWAPHGSNFITSDVNMRLAPSTGATNINTCTDRHASKTNIQCLHTEINYKHLHLSTPVFLMFHHVPPHRDFSLGVSKSSDKATESGREKDLPYVTWEQLSLTSIT